MRNISLLSAKLEPPSNLVGEETTIVINGKYKFRRTGDVQRNIDNMLFLYDN